MLRQMMNRDVSPFEMHTAAVDYLTQDNTARDAAELETLKATSPIDERKLEEAAASAVRDLEQAIAASPAHSRAVGGYVARPKLNLDETAARADVQRCEAVQAETRGALQEARRANETRARRIKQLEHDVAAQDQVLALGNQRSALQHNLDAILERKRGHLQVLPILRDRERIAGEFEREAQQQRDASVEAALLASVKAGTAVEVSHSAGALKLAEARVAAEDAKAVREHAERAIEESDRDARALREQLAQNEQLQRRAESVLAERRLRAVSALLAPEVVRIMAARRLARDHAGHDGEISFPVDDLAVQRACQAAVGEAAHTEDLPAPPPVGSSDAPTVEVEPTKDRGQAAA